MFLHILYRHLHQKKYIRIKHILGSIKTVYIYYYIYLHLYMLYDVADGSSHTTLSQNLLQEELNSVRVLVAGDAAVGKS